MFGDSLLFVLGVSVKLYYFHAVKKRSCNGIERICRGNEETVGKVYRQFDEVIAERLVLLRIEHLEQRGCRIPLHRRTHFVYLVQKNYGIAHSRLSERGYYPSRHGAYVGFAMSADI